MAVFPDRIVLKHSTDGQASIESQIGSGGASEIATGEVVIGVEADLVRMYTLDSAGGVKNFVGGYTGISGGTFGSG